MILSRQKTLLMVGHLSPESQLVGPWVSGGMPWSWSLGTGHHEALKSKMTGFVSKTRHDFHVLWKQQVYGSFLLPADSSCSLL